MRNSYYHPFDRKDGGLVAKDLATKNSFPLEGNAAVAAKGCTGWSMVVIHYCHPDCQPAACLPMQSLTILTIEHPRAAFAALSPSRGRKSKRCFPLLSSQKAQGVSVGKLLFPLEGKCRCCGKRVYGVERRNDTLSSS
jgi:hypothetical protein